jgi:hypothetical protein
MFSLTGSSCPTRRIGQAIARASHKVVTLPTKLVAFGLKRGKFPFKFGACYHFRQRLYLTGLRQSPKAVNNV